MFYDDDYKYPMTDITYEMNKYGYESEIEAKLDTYRMPVDADTINHLYFKNRYSKIGKETIF